MATKYAKQTFITVPNRNTLQTVTPHALAVYVWLCAMQDSAGRAFPSHNRLAELTRQSTRSVIRKLQELEAAGLVTKLSQFNDGKQMSNLYEIMIVDVEPVLEPEELVGVPESHTRSDTVSPPLCHSVTPPVTDSHPPSDTVSHRTKTILTKSNGTKTKELNAVASQPLADKPAGRKKGGHVTFTHPVKEQMAVLYYQVIKALKLPVKNHPNVKAAISKMYDECGGDDAIEYLTFMRDHYARGSWDYKPQVNEALEIHAKRVAIVTSLQQYQRKQTESRGVVI